MLGADRGGGRGEGKGRGRGGEGEGWGRGRGGADTLPLKAPRVDQDALRARNM